MVRLGGRTATPGAVASRGHESKRAGWTHSGALAGMAQSGPWICQYPLLV